MSSYWVIKRGDEYLVGGQVFSKNQWQAARYYARPNNPRPGERVVRVVTRPRPDLAARLAAVEDSMRLAVSRLVGVSMALGGTWDDPEGLAEAVAKLAARLAAWEPVVREVEKMSWQWTNGLGIFDRVMAVIDAYMRVPKEHRP